MNELLNNRYQIVSTLGRGGFGETFLAEDTYMPSRRHCVIKQLKPLIDNPQIEELIRDRFQREAATLEALGEGHSQIPTLYAYFVEAGQYYLVQEWVEGRTLVSCIQQQGTFSEEATRELLLNLLPILDSIHSRGIIHRDIKPDNIILRQRDGLPVLIDFGAVRETMGTQINSQGNPTSSIVIGTPGYMPSEQAAGRPIFSSDLYSLALTAIYMLTRLVPQQLPMDASTGEIIFPAIAISPNLKAVLERASQSHPRDRFPSARAMLDALQSQASPATQWNPQAATLPPPEEPATAFSPPRAEIPPTLPFPPTTTARKSPIHPSYFIAGGLISGAIAIGFFLFQLLATQRSRTIELNYQSSVASPADNPNYAWLSQRQVVDADLIGKTAFELDIMRNSIFARYGRKFDSPELQAYFNNQAWYKGRYEAATFPDSLLSKLEMQNANYILSYQDKNNLHWIKNKEQSTQKPSPKQAIEDYFNEINNGRYEVAWNQLSPRLSNDRNQHPQGYTSYTDWWKTVDRVDLEDVKIFEEGVEVARLEVRIKYHLKSGRISSNSMRIKLIWDGSSQRWLLDDVKAL
ncbi:YARHG domain-containing protein [Oscillatoria sp. FACHB-1406]|uniref:protein kinase domain-containing protein n=1 Tax=Oscillatoria sp. FACHB-1406 TaxID=2692846 RepID=UPI0016893620|nr:YARHG domain-containing protein [Oscillatoria sp. FACHB-1406]